MQQLIATSLTIDAIRPVTLTLIFLFLVFFAALIVRSKSIKHWPKTIVSIAPSTLATVGVIGTFYGIYLGLQDFDVLAIDSSVPALLEGMKTAFVTSLIGMSLSVIYRLISSVVPARTDGVDSAQTAFQAMIDEQKESSRLLREGFENLFNAIGSDDDSSMGTQLGKLRNDVRDGLDKIESKMATEATASRNLAAQHHTQQSEAFDDFAKHMVENTHKALIEALETVISDFNRNLTEQFGDNFKQLNEGVERLVVWQENYRVHIEQIEASFNNALMALQQSDESLKSISESADSIPRAIEPLRGTLETMDEALSRVNRDLEAYASIHDKARDVFPIINENIEAVTTKLAGSVENMINRTDAALQLEKNAARNLEIQYQTIAEEMRGASEKAADELQRSYLLFDQKMKEQLVEQDRKMGEALGAALKTMADNLGSMSAKFVTDYDPLTKQLGEIVRIAANASSHSQIGVKR